MGLTGVKWSLWALSCYTYIRHLKILGYFTSCPFLNFGSLMKNGWLKSHKGSLVQFPVECCSYGHFTVNGDVRASAGLKLCCWMVCAVVLLGSLALWLLSSLSQLNVKETIQFQAGGAEMLWQRKGSTPGDFKALLSHCGIKGGYTWHFTILDSVWT